MEPGPLLELFGDVCEAITRALGPVRGAERRARTPRPGQYAIDLIADEAALSLLLGHDLLIVSEESGVTGPPRAPITVVIDPVDGSSNASRELPYWATSLCALDANGPLAAMVVNHATAEVTTATRGGGAFRDDRPLHASTVERVEDSFVALSTFPNRMLHWKQFRAMGSCALALCDVAAGNFDGYFDGGSVHAPWDYLGGYLICLEAGALVVDLADRPLGIGDPNVRRHLVAAGTPALLGALRKAAGRAGGRIVVAGFGDPANVREKSAGDWVSDVDTASERAVAALLAEAAPDVAFFGEETGGTRAELGWICDPLDGTANFLHGFPAVGVSVALVHDGVPIVGVVHAPLLGTTYRATAGAGAYRDGVALRVSTRTPDHAMVATGFPFRHADLKDPYLGVFGRALRRFEDLRRAGAASLDLAWTAAGVFDGYFELRLGPWDVAAGALLVREAGGVVTDWAGDDRAWLDSGNIVVGPPEVHAATLELIRESGIQQSGPGADKIV